MALAKKAGALAIGAETADTIQGRKPRGVACSHINSQQRMWERCGARMKQSANACSGTRGAAEMSRLPETSVAPTAGHPPVNP